LLLLCGATNLKC